MNIFKKLNRKHKITKRHNLVKRLIFNIKNDSDFEIKSINKGDGIYWSYYYDISGYFNCIYFNLFLLESKHGKEFYLHEFNRKNQEEVLKKINSLTELEIKIR